MPENHLPDDEQEHADWWDGEQDALPHQAESSAPREKWLCTPAHRSKPSAYWSTEYWL